MPNYNTILFDIDDTLFDFEIDQRKAFKEAMRKIGYESNDEMYEEYNTLNLSLWEELNQGKLSIDELLEKRFRIFFDRNRIDIEPRVMNKELSRAFQKTGTPINGTKETLEKLKDQYELAITSNGLKNQQYDRLENAGFSKYFSKIFLSEEIGYNKPDTRYFEVVLNNIENKDKSKILIVGDSILSDINGGYKAGLHTCWYNAKNKENNTNIKPDYEIRNFNELLNIV